MKADVQQDEYAQLTTKPVVLTMFNVLCALLRNERIEPKSLLSSNPSPPSPSN
jgi:hypothetical protein